jgi:Alpha/beta hydrolase domain
MGSSTTVDLASNGYVEHEYVAAGTTTSYTVNGALPGDGRWTFEDATAAPYRTRALVRRPASARGFSGTVVVEWLNVTSATDSDVVWAEAHEELVRRGDAWVGVSAQIIGVNGGSTTTGTSTGLKGADPVRYDPLEHPGDGYSFDIFTQVGRAIRAGGAPMGNLKPRRLLAAGRSQSAAALVTYLNGVQPQTHAFDGFLLHSRFKAAVPLVAPGQAIDIASTGSAAPTMIRTDTDVPVLDLQSEFDVSFFDSLAARQPDNKHFRLWEVAGTSHADQHTLGTHTLPCTPPVNNAPMHVVAKAALHALDRWVRGGAPPTKAPRIKIGAATRQIVRDADGIAEGGIRTPPVEVPIDVLAGVPGSPIACLLFGTTTPLAPERLAALYPSRAAYVQRFTTAVDKTIKAGFALNADRDALLGYAQPSLIG